MTDKTELEVTTTDDGKEYVIRKGGYFYRPKAEGYTSNANDAGRFSLKQAILHSFPNGPDGPRDGITYELATRTPDPTPVVPDDGLDRLLTALAKIMPIRVQDGPDYAEVYFSDGVSHSTQAMTTNPQDWLDIAAALAAYRGEA